MHEKTDRVILFADKFYKNNTKIESIISVRHRHPMRQGRR